MKLTLEKIPEGYRVTISKGKYKVFAENKSREKATRIAIKLAFELLPQIA